MEKRNYREAVERLVAEGDPYSVDAYLFLRDALTAAMTESQKRKEGADPHVSGRELLEGFRDLALKRFGPMTLTVLEEWNITKCEDVGTMVFSLIKAGVFGKSENDSIEDFSSVYDFEETFADPFKPKRRSGSGKVRMPSRRRKPESFSD